MFARNSIDSVNECMHGTLIVWIIIIKALRLPVFGQKLKTLYKYTNGSHAFMELFCHALNSFDAYFHKTQLSWFLLNNIWAPNKIISSYSCFWCPNTYI